MNNEPIMPTEELKPRELEVLRLIADGLSNKEIAEKLHIAVTTVRWHNRQLYSKLGVHTRTKVVAYAQQLGLLQLESIEQSNPVPYNQNQESNFPTYLTPLVGRQREVSKIKQLLKSSRLLTLTGPGGTGKTRLALKILEELQHEFQDGVFYVPLTTIRDPQMVIFAIANAFNIHEGHDTSLETNLAQWLHNKEILLVIDNFEHIIQVASLLSRLLKKTKRLKIVVTSREVLHLYGEQEYPVPPLTIPDQLLSFSSQDVAKFEATTLFVQRAQAILPHFSINNDNAASIAEICSQLDGLPLAIELAAARINLLTPQKILEMLQQGLDGLGKGPRDVPARHRTLRATIDWSYALLSDEERGLITRLSVFNSGWQLDAMEAICHDDSQHDLLDKLALLINKSLVQVANDASDEPRFSMLETIRQYAAEQLPQSEANRLQMRHFEWFLDIAERAEQGLQSYESQRWYAKLRIEEGNMRAALQWSASNLDNAQQGVHLAGALWNYWHLCGNFSEGRSWLTLLLDQMSSMVSSKQARALNGAGIMAYRQGDYDEVVRYCGDALAISEQLGDLNESALALHYLAHVEQEQGHFDQAIQTLSRSLDQYAQLQNNWGRAQTMNCLGDLQRQLGNYDAAIELLEDALILQREINNRRGIMTTLSNLGHVLCQLHHVDEADQCFRESMTIAQMLNTQPYIALMLDGFAGVAVVLGKFEKAIILLGAVEELLHEFGVVLEPADRVDFEFHRTQAKNALDDKTFKAALLKGKQLSLMQAVEYALSED